MALDTRHRKRCQVTFAKVQHVLQMLDLRTSVFNKLPEDDTFVPKHVGVDT